MQQQLCCNINQLGNFLVSNRGGGYGAMLQQFPWRSLGFICHAPTQNMHLWMMKTGSAARHMSRMDHINRLLLPLKSKRGVGNWYTVYV